MKYIASIGFILSVVGISAWFGYSYGKHRTENEWRTRELVLVAAATDASNEMLRLEREAAKRLQEAGDEHAKRVAVLRANHDRAFDKLRHAYETGCTSVSHGPAAASGNDDTAERDRLFNRIAERLKAVAVAADDQTERLVSCQSYVTSITKQ